MKKVKKIYQDKISKYILKRINRHIRKMLLMVRISMRTVQYAVNILMIDKIKLWIWDVDRASIITDTYLFISNISSLKLTSFKIIFI